MNNAQKPCSHCSRATGEEYKYMTLAVVHPCCFVHNKQDNASPASLGERKRSITQLRRRGGVEILLCSTSSTVRTQQSQKCVKNNILHTHHKTDGDVEEEREGAWHWLRSASQSNYILILWKLHKCWPLGKFHGSRSHCIECVLLLLLYPVLRLVGGCDKGPVCLQFLSVAVACGWCVPSLWTQSFWQRRSSPTPGDIVYSCIRFIFAAMASPDSHRIY